MSEAKANLAFKVRGASIGMKVDDPVAVIEKVQAGLPYEAFEKLQKVSHLAAETLAQLVQIAPRTLTRRKIDGRFKPDESDRLLRASSIFEKAVALFEGDADAARQWLQSPQRALHNHTPLDFAGTEVGSREVEDLIGRLEHGVFT